MSNREYESANLPKGTTHGHDDIFVVLIGRKSRPWSISAEEMCEQDDARHEPGCQEEDALILLSLVLQQLDVQDPVFVSSVSFRLFSEKPGDVGAEEGDDRLGGDDRGEFFCARSRDVWSRDGDSHLSSDTERDDDQGEVEDEEFHAGVLEMCESGVSPMAFCQNVSSGRVDKSRPDRLIYSGSS